MTEILIYGDIGENLFGDGLTAKSVKAQLNGAQGDISVRISSYGGDVFEGFAIYNLLDQYPGKVDVTVDSVAASAASIVMMSGDRITMSANAFAMIHKPWTMALGDAGDMRSTADLLDKIEGSIVSTYSTRTGLDEVAVSQMMLDETWFNSAEALEQGFVHEVIENTKEPIAYNTIKPWFKNAPKPEQIPQDMETQAAYRVAMCRRRLAIEE